MSIFIFHRTAGENFKVLFFCEDDKFFGPRFFTEKIVDVGKS